MKYTISTKKFKLSDKTLKHIRKHVQKIDHLLPTFNPGLVNLDLILKKHKKKSSDPLSAHPSVDNPIYYDGTIKMILPKKPLVVNLKGSTVDEAINIGFDHLFREIETYKGKHFSAYSEYFNHDTIRRNSTSFLIPHLADSYEVERIKLVEEHIKPSGITDKRVISAMLSVPRHEFVPQELVRDAYLDTALAIGEGQTISQPSLVAKMTQELNLTDKEKVLEIGTGSGYQAAILSKLAKEVYTVEIIETLARRARKVLKRLGYDNVHVEKGNGTLGLVKFAPYDAIIVTAAGPEIPKTLIDQLKESGRILAPVGDTYGQYLNVGLKKKGIFEVYKTIPVMFVPLRGRFGIKVGHERIAYE